MTDFDTFQEAYDLFVQIISADYPGVLTSAGLNQLNQAFCLGGAAVFNLASQGRLSAVTIKAQIEACRLKAIQDAMAEYKNTLQ